MDLQKQRSAYMQSLNHNIIKSYAKINIGLKILDIYPDGYHSIWTIMHEINLHDIITINKRTDNLINLNLSGDITVPNDANNLCIKAAQLFFDFYNINNKGLDIYLNKNIPVGAGLGGGSSNAASILLILNKIFKLGATKDDLRNIGFKLGCDVPFFIDGGAQISEGKGEKLSPVSFNLDEHTILLVCPEFSISTKWAYSFFKNNLPKSFNRNKFRTFQNNIDWSLFENDFEEVVKTTYPEVMKIRDRLESSGALFVSLSGSGSTMFGIFNDFSKAELAQQILKPYLCHIVKPIMRK